MLTNWSVVACRRVGLSADLRLLQLARFDHRYEGGSGWAKRERKVTLVGMITTDGDTILTVSHSTCRHWAVLSLRRRRRCVRAD